ncbi:MAG: hypothetical protein HUK40_18735 [Desulfobacter sp.]|nr:hypothetical protein [Desulfobacter sp.]WDP86714.1 MAG: hypothetical protein HUN05_17595 [Desulfobacter sp.]
MKYQGDYSHIWRQLRRSPGQCDGKQSCHYVVNYKVIGDPARGCQKTYRVRYKCGNSTQVKEKRLSPEAEWDNKKVILDCR